MSPISIVLLLFLLIPASWTYISNKNKVIEAASVSFTSGKYEEAIENHLKLITDFELNTPTVNFNLALSFQGHQQLEEAQKNYQTLVSSPNAKIASYASNQNGVLLGQQKKYEEALLAFKIALIKNPFNEEARYNYELLSRWLDENKDQQQNQDQEGEDQQDQEGKSDQKDQNKQSEENKDGKGDEKTQEDKANKSEKKDDKSGEKSQQEKDSEEASDLESDLSDRQKAQEKMKERLQNMNLSPEQASQILDAMNAAEMRYIQQNRKKPVKRPDKGLPDW
jgi:tetratricopeptide (TPR) repeat protein